MRPRDWLLFTLIFLGIIISRLMRLDDMILNRDEIWSVWQTLGTPQQIIQWTPYDWTPLYYLTLGAWRGAVGMYPVILRAFSTLLFPIGAACVFRVMRRWRGIEAGLLASLAYGALGFSILLSLEVRGYALLLALLPLALWLTVRYFDCPAWRRALPLALVLAAMFYTSLTSFGAFLILGIFTLIVYRMAVWRWWLPGVLASLLAAPEIVAKAQIAGARVAATQTLTLPSLPEALLRLFQDYTGLTWPLWAFFLLIVIWQIIRRPTRQRAYAVALLVWAVAVPVLLYTLNPLTGFFSARYAWWVLPGIALLMGWGLSYLPRIGQVVSALAMSAALFFPLPSGSPYQIWDVLSPLNENFAWLRENMQWGDVVLNHTDHDCGAPEEWDYYLRTYFPNSLRFVDSPQTYRRLWVLNPDDLPDEMENNLRQQYLHGRFVGPPGCLFRLYEAPPDVQGIAFENGLRFHGADVLDGDNPVSGPLVRHEGETVRLRLWWSADRAPELDYSISTYLARNDTIYDQIDGPPEAFYPPDAPPETSRWQPGTYYVEERQLTLPYPAGGFYDLKLVVYFWEDGVPVSAPGVDERGHLPLLRIQVRSY